MTAGAFKLAISKSWPRINTCLVNGQIEHMGNTAVRGSFISRTGVCDALLTTFPVPLSRRYSSQNQTLHPDDDGPSPQTPERSSLRHNQCG